jgi:hypothetical protein
MDVTILDNIPIQIDPDSLMRRLRIEKGSSWAEDLGRLTEEAEVLMRPKAMYRPVYIDAKDDDSIVVNGIPLNSRVLRVNVEEAHRVFPYVATCGDELDRWARSKEDILERFWADSIQQVTVRLVVRFMNEDMTDRHGLGSTSQMAPGSLPDWSIEEQQSLFAVLGDAKAGIGVELSESLMMVPEHSVSGVVFPTEVRFESCQLCPREKCPGRRAAYDEDLYDRRYRKGGRQDR